MKFKVGVTEELHTTIEVEANNETEAKYKVEEMYKNEEIILTADDYSGAYFDIEKEELSLEEKEKKEITNYFDINQNTYDFARKCTNEIGYEVLEVMRLSNHKFDRNLYVVMDYNENAMKGYKYVSWIMNNRGLDSGKYSNSFKECLKDCADRLFDYKENIRLSIRPYKNDQEQKKEQNIEDDFEDIDV